MGLTDIFSDFYAAIGIAEIHAEAPPEEEEEGEGNDEGGEDKEEGEGEGGEDGGEEEGGDEEGGEEEEEEEEEEVEDPKPKLEEGRDVLYYASLQFNCTSYFLQRSRLRRGDSMPP